MISSSIASEIAPDPSTFEVSQAAFRELAHVLGTTAGTGFAVSVSPYPDNKHSGEFFEVSSVTTQQSHRFTAAGTLRTFGTRSVLGEPGSTFVDSYTYPGSTVDIQPKPGRAQAALRLVGLGTYVVSLQIPPR